MQTIDPNQVFARVQNNAITEFPVMGLHITNRAHPVEWYQEVVYEPKPAIDNFHYLAESAYLDANQVVKVQYTIEPIGLEQMLSRNVDRTDPEKLVALSIAKFDEAEMNRIIWLVTEYVQLRLDNFAKLKGYSGILSAISYTNSTVLYFASDSIITNKARDETWTALYKYLDDIKAELEPVPMIVQEIEKVLPVLSWEPVV
jgi:hypothetical protein